MLVGALWDRTGIDLTGRYPCSQQGNRYLLTYVDYFTKFAEVYAISNKEAETVCRVLAEEVFPRYGVPLQVVTDQGREFENRFLRELCHSYGIDNVRTSPYRPSTNGAIERLRRTLNAMLGRAVEKSLRDWNLRVPAIMASYRASRHESTGYSPNFLMFDRELRAPVDVLLGDPSQTHYTAYDPFVEELLENQVQAYALVWEHVKTRAERNRKGYNLRVRPVEFPVGTWVLYFSPRKFQGCSSKWQRNDSGPYLVV